MDARPFLVALAALVACTDPKTDTGPDLDTGDTGEPEETVAFTVSGTAINLMDPAATPAAEGLCVSAADPTEAITGGEVITVSSSTIGAAGAYEVTGVNVKPVVGLLMLVEDCGDEGTVLPTATGIPSDAYMALEDGDVLADTEIYSIDGASQAALQAGLEAAGYVGDLATEGSLIGFVLDVDGTPIEGATMHGRSGDTVYYYDGTGFGATATTAAGRGMWVIPEAPIYNYSCEADGLNFDNKMTGSQPGYAVVATFRPM